MYLRAQKGVIIVKLKKKEICFITENTSDVTKP